MKLPVTKKQDIYHYFYGVLIGIICLCFAYSASSLLKLQTQTFRTQTKSDILAINNPRKLNIPILMYHYVEYVRDPRDTIRQTMDILPPVFENQIVTLKNDGYTFLTPSDINLILANKRPLPKKPIILSFDDGYEDFYTDVMPILQKHKVRAVAYIITQFLDTPNYMESDQLREVKKTGLIEIACHTQHHPALKTSTVKQATAEIVGCRKDLASEFGIKTISFAYPYGSYDTFLFPILKKAGFQNAVTTEPGTDVSNANIYAIPRLRPGRRIGEELTSYINSELPNQNQFTFVKPASARETNLGE